MNSESRRWWPFLLSAVLFLGIALWPNIPGMQPTAQRLLAVTVVMATLWLTQPISIAVTSFIPLAAYPLLGILTAQEVSTAYANQNVFLFLGGFIIALAIEQVGLHRRIALHIISRVGSSPRLIVFGFMLATALLSMWLSNTATTMMMLPIALALLSTLRDSIPSTGKDGEHNSVDSLTIPLLLGIAYAASCGGLSTFVGTPTNLSLRGYWEEHYIDQGYESLSMAEWMTTYVPLSMAMLFIAGLVMTWNLKPLSNSEQLGRNFFRDQLKTLGKATKAEQRLFLLFIITAALWILRKPLKIGNKTILPDWPGMVVSLANKIGWDLGYLSAMVQDSTIAMAMAMLVFIIPGNKNEAGQHKPIMTWDVAQPRLPWGMILLIGSGFAMAAAFERTQLAAWIGEITASAFHGQPTIVLVLGICILVTFLTEFTTNVATVNTLLPTLGAMAVSLDIDPRLLLIPATVSASCAFMLPIATPPNAIIFGSGKVPISSMVRYGIILNLIGAVLVTLVTYMIGIPVFGIETN